MRTTKYTYLLVDLLVLLQRVFYLIESTQESAVGRTIASSNVVHKANYSTKRQQMTMKKSAKSRTPFQMSGYKFLLWARDRKRFNAPH